MSANSSDIGTSDKLSTYFYSEVNIMDFNYEEIGRFNTEKAAKGLIELAQKVKKEETKDDIEEKPSS